MLAVANFLFWSEALAYVVGGVALLAAFYFLREVFLILRNRRQVFRSANGLGLDAGSDDLVSKAAVTAGLDPVTSYPPLRPRVLSDPGLLPLVVLSGVAGAGAGLICGFFRQLLQILDGLRQLVPEHFSAHPLAGASLLVIGAAAAGAISVGLVRRFSENAAGSGIPHVEAVISGELPPASLPLLPVKFFGGLISIGAGFALGREGPSVQMGATFAHLLGKAFGRNEDDCRSLLAAGAGAGLAAAFNAPFAGAVFVLEELTRKFAARDAITALGASGSAIVAARLFTGPAPDFSVAALPFPSLTDNLLCIGLGAIAALVGVLYNRLLIKALDISARLTSLPPEARAALVGVVVGAVAWIAPSLAGGGDVLTQAVLAGHAAIAFLPLLFMMRLLLGAASYAAGTPGGIFAPLLALGAQLGAFFGEVFHWGAADPTLHAVAFALVGMAALFTAVVRAPLTGMILVTEMTDNSTELLPMLAACFAAMAVSTLLREPPLYDTLKERAVAQALKKEGASENPKKVRV
ncbi:MAG TPA: H(+)/Cl(-) exchange transporter ClcA [Methylocella sp.]|nr:H(+)/Cl(-) exchange transporter ClcA [Methylocella sp.]